MPVQPELAPPDAHAVDDSRPGAAADLHAAAVVTALVEDAHHAARGEPARLGVAWVHLQQRFTLDVAQALHVHEGRIEEVARRRRDHGQRELRRAARSLVVGQVVGQAVQPQGSQARTVELALARGSGEAALCKRRLRHTQRGKALGQQFVEVDGVSIGDAAQALVTLRETRIRVAHVPGQIPEDLAVRPCLAHRRDGRAVQQHVGMAIRDLHIPVLQLGRGGQQVVGVVGGVGLEMLQHDGEEVFAREAPHHFRRVRRDGHGVAVVDDQRLDRRPEAGRRRPQQVVPDGVHVDGARRLAGAQVRALQGGALDRKVARRRQQQPACALPPGTDQRGQAGDGTDRIAAAAHALHAVVQADGGRVPAHCALAVGPGEVPHLLRVQAAHPGRPLGWPLQRAGPQGVPAQGVACNVVMVEPAVAHQLVHDAEGQRGIGAGQQRDVFMAFVGCLGAARVDADQAGALALGLLRMAPEVQVAGNRIAAPDQDQPRLREELHLHAQLAAYRVGQPFGGRAGADGAVQQRGAELVEEAPGDAFPLHQAHGACIAVGQDGLGGVRAAPGYRLQPAGNVGERGLPAHRRELPAALGAAALEGLQDAFGVVGALRVARDLGAQGAVGVRVRRVALQPRRHAVFDGGDEGTGVRAIMRAGAQHGGGCGHGRGPPRVDGRGMPRGGHRNRAAY